jgi:hypothetical protein
MNYFLWNKAAGTLILPHFISFCWCAYECMEPVLSYVSSCCVVITQGSVNCVTNSVSGSVVEAAQLAPWNSALLEKPAVAQLLMFFQHCYGT